MNARVTGALGLGVLAAAAGFATFRSQANATAKEATPAVVETTSASNDVLPQVANALDLDSPMGKLPPGHPAINGSGDMQSATMPAASDEPDTLKWTVPINWKTVDNPSTMRLATYEVPRASGDVDRADLSVVRAGGTAEANAQRWVGQFDEAGRDTRSIETIRGVKVTIAEVSGTYLGGGAMGGSNASPKIKWALLGAIVEGRGLPYFFKLVGPIASVRAARPAFDAMIATLTAI
ncbi:MAG: hypothetical protein ABI183_08625 [Polyangiaceae bacterium]